MTETPDNLIRSGQPTGALIDQLVRKAYAAIPHKWVSNPHTCDAIARAVVDEVLPVIASVDENADARGYARARAELGLVESTDVVSVMIDRRIVLAPRAGETVLEYAERVVDTVLDAHDAAAGRSTPPPPPERPPVLPDPTTPSV